jgi:AcrR family transcriptional regulator
MRLLISFQKEIYFKFEVVKKFAGVAMGRPKEVTNEEIVVAARRCFLDRGAGVSVVDIAREIGVTHTTVFNRFGSKEALMIAALAPPEKVPWIGALEAGPDERPIPEQLVEHGKVMSAYFQKLQAGLAVLNAAGITRATILRGRKGEPPPVQAFRALTSWLRRAQGEGRMAKCDVETLAATIIGALHSWAFTARICRQSVAPAAGERHVERFIALLWDGIGGCTP